MTLFYYLFKSLFIWLENGDITVLPTRDCLSSSNPQLQTNSTATLLEAKAENQLHLSNKHLDPKWSCGMFQRLTIVLDFPQVNVLLQLTLNRSTER